MLSYTSRPSKPGIQNPFSLSLPCNTKYCNIWNYLVPRWGEKQRVECRDKTRMKIGGDLGKTIYFLLCLVTLLEMTLIWGLCNGNINYTIGLNNYSQLSDIDLINLTLDYILSPNIFYENSFYLVVATFISHLALRTPWDGSIMSTL